MLTALAVLQHNNVKLPEKRVDLYGSILDWLSKQRAKAANACGRSVCCGCGNSRWPSGSCGPNRLTAEL
jgi:hypothetical protein